MKAFRNPLERARNHGSAGSGVGHWWKQRFTAILLIPLTIWMVWSLMVLSSADYAAARAWMSSPWNASMALLLVGSTFYHARLGVQVVIEDYIHHRATEVSLQIIIAAAALAGAILAAFAILKVAFAG